jgi:hypothetical protein
MYRLYLDTCILNDTFPLWQREQGGSVHLQDIKIPLSRWAAEYVALYHLLDLDDQWELEFGTSEATLDEISRFQVGGTHADEKKAFLEDIADTLYSNFLEKCKPESIPIVPNLLQRARKLLGDEGDALQICQAVQGGWEFFITTDFRTILVHQSSLEEIVFKTHGYQGKLWPQGGCDPPVEKLGIKARSPLQFLEQHLLPLPMLIRTLYGSWTDPDEFLDQTAQALLALSRQRS